MLQSGAASNAGGVQLLGVTRELDIFVQRQLRAELAGASYAGKVNDYYQRIAQIYGQPGGLNALDTLYNNFSNSLRSLMTSPEWIAMRTDVLNQGGRTVQQLNAMSGDIQELRTQAEISIDAAVDRVNEILQSIERISAQLVSATPASAEVANLLDTRDTLIAELSKLIDVRVVELERGQISIFTNSGVSLFDHKAAHLAFDGRDTIGPQSLWNIDPDLRKVGTIKLVTPSGYQLDLIADKAIRSGEIAANLEMRDRILVQAQAQLDEIAHALALALSNTTVTGDVTTSGAAAGLQIDLAELKNGNEISLTYTDNVGGQQQRVTIVRVDDPGALPLNDGFTADPNDTVIGVDFSAEWPRSLLRSTLLLGQPVCHSTIRPVTSCAYSMMARRISWTSTNLALRLRPQRSTSATCRSRFSPTVDRIPPTRTSLRRPDHRNLVLPHASPSTPS